LLKQGQLKSYNTVDISSDEIGMLWNTLIEVNANLREIVKGILESAGKVAESSNQMNSISVQVAEGPITGRFSRRGIFIDGANGFGH